MKQVTLEDAAKNLDALLREAEQQVIVIVREGRPVGVLSAWPDLDEESLATATSAGFWRMIESRRKGKAIPWEQAKQDAGL